MRIIAGKYRGSKLEVLDGNVTRPTLDQVKESIFNHLGPYFFGGHVLDAFAGSGAIGFEFLSRGVEFVDFVEKNKSAFSVIKKNYSKLKCPKNCHFYLGDSFEFLSTNQKKYDYVFIDPPYDQYDLGLYLKLLFNHLHQNSLVIIECAKTSEVTIPLEYVVDWQKEYRLNKCIILKISSADD